MTRHIHRKLLAAVLTAILIVGGSGVAYAYFTSQGSGTGSAITGSTGANDFAFTGYTATGLLYPGGDPLDVSFTATNNGGGPEYLGTVYVSVASDSGGDAVDANGDPIAGCEADWYSLSESSVDVDAELGSGDTSAHLPAGAISMVDAGVSQDACQNATIELDFSTTNG